MHLNIYRKLNCTVFISKMTITIFATLLSSTCIIQPANAQQNSFSDPTVKTLLSGAIENLQRGNVNNTLEHLNLIDDQLSSASSNQTSSSAQQRTLQLLIQDAIDSLLDQDNDRAIVYLNLSAQNIGLQLSDKNTTAVDSPSLNVTNTTTANASILEYANPVFGFRMQYPSNWTAIESEYNPAANNTVVGFFAQSKTASELGNISGVSGSFVPYLDIYVFDSKNMSLSKIVNSTINNLSPPENFVIYDSKPEIIGGNLSGHILLYDTIIGDGEHFRKLQAFTIFDGNVFVITYTAQQALFPNYLLAVHKMVESFKQT
jgi:transcriptional regulator with PAS, ATPase and Fis domain